MENLTTILLIFNAIVIILVSFYLIYKSKKRQAKLRANERKKQKDLQNLNQQLDQTKEQLDAINPIVEKVSEAFSALNEEVVNNN